MANEEVSAEDIYLRYLYQRLCETLPHTKQTKEQVQFRDNTARLSQEAKFPDSDIVANYIDKNMVNLCDNETIYAIIRSGVVTSPSDLVARADLCEHLKGLLAPNSIQSIMSVFIHSEAVCANAVVNENIERATDIIGWTLQFLKDEDIDKTVVRGGGWEQYRDRQLKADADQPQSSADTAGRPATNQPSASPVVNYDQDSTQPFEIQNVEEYITSRPLTRRQPKVRYSGPVEEMSDSSQPFSVITDMNDIHRPQTVRQFLHQDESMYYTAFESQPAATLPVHGAPRVELPYSHQIRQQPTDPVVEPIAPSPRPVHPQPLPTIECPRTLASVVVGASVAVATIAALMYVLRE